MSETILSNAFVVTRNEAFRGTVVFDASGVRAVDVGASTSPAAVDCDGDLLIPGLIEMHTDNVEHHFEPRPGVNWPSATAAMQAHDAQMACAGITTVFDAICVGDYGPDGKRRRLLDRTVEAIRFGTGHDVFRAEHLVHLRCEVSDVSVADDFAQYADDPLVRLVSVMDHTPGQRQWRNLDKMRKYHSREQTWTDEEFAQVVEQRQVQQQKHSRVNREAVVALWRPRELPLASHDDTTEEHVDEAVSDGVTIAEFPTTLVAARKAKAAGMVNIAGAPNLVRGASHSGNVAAGELAAEGLLDAFSSDYVPVSLLQAALRLEADYGFAMPAAIGTVTHNVADMLSMEDRGEIAPGKRADLVRARLLPDGTGIVRGVWRAGRPVA